jgi:hypothetical protein
MVLWNPGSTNPGGQPILNYSPDFLMSFEARTTRYALMAVVRRLAPIPSTAARP